MEGVELRLFHPEVATRDCGDCQKWLYDEKTGKRDESRGYPTKRHHGCPPPCRTREGCKKGTPEKPKELSSKNLAAYLHYLECKAVGQFPDDAIVRRNASMIRQIEELKEQRDRLITLEAMVPR